MERSTQTAPPTPGRLAAGRTANERRAWEAWAAAEVWDGEGYSRSPRVWHPWGRARPRRTGEKRGPFQGWRQRRARAEAAARFLVACVEKPGCEGAGAVRAGTGRATAATLGAGVAAGRRGAAHSTRRACGARARSRSVAVASKACAAPLTTGVGSSGSDRRPSVAMVPRVARPRAPKRSVPPPRRTARSAQANGSRSCSVAVRRTIRGRTGRSLRRGSGGPLQDMGTGMGVPPRGFTDGSVSPRTTVANVRTGRARESTPPESNRSPTILPSVEQAQCRSVPAAHPRGFPGCCQGGRRAPLMP